MLLLLQRAFMLEPLKDKNEGDALKTLTIKLIVDLLLNQIPLHMIMVTLLEFAIVVELADLRVLLFQVILFFP